MFVELAAGHPVAQIGFAVIAGVAFHHLLAVAENDDAPANGLAFVEFVRDEQHGDALLAQAIDDADQVANFAARQCGGRLIHDDQVRVDGNGAGDRHHLARRDGQGVDALLHERLRGRQTNCGERARGGLRQDGAIQTPEEAAARLNELLGQGDVFRHVQVGQQRKILIDGFDAGGQRLDGGKARIRAPGDDDLSFIRRLRAGDDLDQGAFAAAVFSDQMVNLTAFDRQVDAAQGVDAGETFVDAAHFEKRRLIGSRRRGVGLPAGVGRIHAITGGTMGRSCHVVIGRRRGACRRTLRSCCMHGVLQHALQARLGLRTGSSCSSTCRRRSRLRRRR